MSKIVVIVGSLRRDSINRKLADALAKLAGPRHEFTFAQDRRPAAVQPGPGAESAGGRDPPERRDRSRRRRADRHARVQPLDPRRAQERHRLGLAPLRQELVRRQADRRHRHIGRRHRHRRSAAASAQHPGLSQRHPDGAARRLHPFKQGLVDDQHNVTDESVRKFLQLYMDTFTAWVERYGK